MVLTANKPRLLLPGFAPPDPGVEQYRVHGGGATVIPIRAGDEVTVVDREGGQRAEVVVLGPAGPDGARVFGVNPDAPAAALAALAGSMDDDAQQVAAALAQRGLDPSGARAIALFGAASPAGESVTWRAAEDATIVVAAPGGPMQPGAQDPPTELRVLVRRATPRQAGDMVLPAPLAPDFRDVHIDARTAVAYEVEAGEFIQVIDVQGQECSDFLAFDRRRLEGGAERGLDATTTRTLMGAAYPGPGLFSKFYDQDMQPLVEVVRDTVGRHDTFGLACTSKYYADMGYPGHVNCTDNFNAAIAPYAIEARRGWPAINFFYNTGIDANNVLFLDEPWSRPGDYVLLRAMQDLVCSSSACPDDIDAANAWNPTDIHVRIYPAERAFSKAVAFRVTPDAEPVLTRETGFHPRTSALTRRFAEYRGYWLPTSFSSEGAVEEYWACRERAAVMDLSPLRKWEILGPDAENLLQAACTRNIRKLAIGQVVYTAICYETGGMVDDATVFRLGPDNFRFVGGDEYDGIWLRELAERLGLRVWVRSSTDQLHNLAVQGPASRDILRDVIWTAPAQPGFDELTWFRFAVARVGGFDGIPIVVSRTGYSGELGYEVWCHPKDGPAVWDAIWQSGEPRGLTPLGLDALDMLRIEAGLVFAHYEFDDQVDPFEAGIGFTVALSKEDDFVGRAALEKRKATPQRVLVGLELEGHETAAHGDCVHVGRLQTGVVTSGCRSPILRKNIALCRMAVEYADIGTEVEVGKLDGHAKRIPATVVRFPFYDPQKKKPRS